MHEEYGKIYSILYACLNAIDKIHVAGREAQVFGLWSRQFAAQQPPRRRRGPAGAGGVGSDRRGGAATASCVLAVIGLSLERAGRPPSWSPPWPLEQFVLALGQMGQAVESAFALLPASNGSSRCWSRPRGPARRQGTRQTSSAWSERTTSPSPIRAPRGRSSRRSRWCSAGRVRRGHPGIRARASRRWSGCCSGFEPPRTGQSAL